jgi:hypothetical protein
MFASSVRINAVPKGDVGTLVFGEDQLGGIFEVVRFDLAEFVVVQGVGVEVDVKRFKFRFGI